MAGTGQLARHPIDDLTREQRHALAARLRLGEEWSGPKPDPNMHANLSSVGHLPGICYGYLSVGHWQCWVLGVLLFDLHYSTGNPDNRCDARPENVLRELEAS